MTCSTIGVADKAMIKVNVQEVGRVDVANLTFSLIVVKRRGVTNYTIGMAGIVVVKIGV